MRQQNARSEVAQHTAETNKSRPTLSVSDKIFQVQHDKSMKFEKTGPELDLFFHELKNDKSVGQKFLNYLIAGLGCLLMIFLYPILALGIKLSSSEPVVQRIETEGKSGRLFDRYEFSTSGTANPTSSSTRRERFMFGTILHKIGLYKLPACINVFKGEMNLVGPFAFCRKESTYWNNVFDDFYKRHAIKPGLIPVVIPENSNPTFPDIHSLLKKEFRYVIKSGLMKDLKILFGRR